MKTIIRHATHNDIEQLMSMAVLMHAESPRYSRMAFSAEKVRNLWVMLLGMDNGVILVAEQGGVLTGGLAAIVCPHWMSDELMSVDYGLFVLPEYRGNMTACRLVNEYITWASQQGVKPGFVGLGISTGVQEEKTATFLQAMGFKQSSIGFEV